MEVSTPFFKVASLRYFEICVAYTRVTLDELSHDEHLFLPFVLVLRHPISASPSICPHSTSGSFQQTTNEKVYRQILVHLQIFVTSYTISQRSRRVFFSETTSTHLLDGVLQMAEENKHRRQTNLLLNVTFHNQMVSST